MKVREWIKENYPEEWEKAQKKVELKINVIKGDKDKIKELIKPLRKELEKRGFEVVIK